MLVGRFVYSLSLVLLELKSPADPNVDLWKAFEQLQTYKELIFDVLARPRGVAD